MTTEFRHGIPIIKDETEKNIEIPINKKDNEFWKMSEQQLMEKNGNVWWEENKEQQNETNQTVSETPSVQNAFEVAKSLRDEQWAREDEIREHVEAREDTAWTRSIRDMIRAGINPNLVNATPAGSGGGITNATGIDYSMYEAEMNKNLELVMQEIEKNYQGNQKEKDRFTDLISRLIQLAGLATLKK